MTDEEGKINDRIRKLLAMGNDTGGNEQERETALRRAYALMTKHNLTQADIGSGQSQEKREEQVARLSVYPWARGIAHSLATLFFCSYYFQRGAGKLANHSFVGRQSNAVTASEMSTYIIAGVFKELRARFGTETSPTARNFATGVETAIRMRCNALRREAEEAEKAAAAPKAGAVMECEDGSTLALAGPATGTALVLASLYASERTDNDAWIAEHIGKLATSADRTKGVGGNAYAAGKAHGSTISLNRQVGGKSGNLRIK